MHVTNEVAATSAEADRSLKPATASSSSATPGSANVGSAVALPIATTTIGTTTAVQDKAGGGSASARDFESYSPAPCAQSYTTRASPDLWAICPIGRSALFRMIKSKGISMMVHSTTMIKYGSHQKHRLSLNIELPAGGQKEPTGRMATTFPRLMVFANVAKDVVAIAPRPKPILATV